MKLTIIGCWGGYPKVNEASSGYLLEHNGFQILIDCGSGVLSKLQQYLEPNEIDAIIISHYHADHVADIGVLQHALLINKYLSGKKTTLPIYGHDLNPGGFSQLTYKDITEGRMYHPKKLLQLGPFSISFLRTEHPVPCFAFRIETGEKSIVYTADGAFQTALIDFAKEADLLLCECNFYGDMSGKEAGHMNSFETGRLAKEANVKKMILTHLPHYGDLNMLREEAGSVYPGPIELAEMGKILTW